MKLLGAWGALVIAVLLVMVPWPSGPSQPTRTLVVGPAPLGQSGGAWAGANLLSTTDTGTAQGHAWRTTVAIDFVNPCESPA